MKIRLYLLITFTLRVLPENIVADVAAVQRIPIIPTLLEVVCRTTGMGFAAVARVTNELWVACAVRDEIMFGLQPGGELELESTICHEVRQSGKEIIIDHVDADPEFCKHHTPKQYGFQSYISLPIFLKNGDFFGTLCALDPRPAKLNNPATVGLFKLFAELISFHLYSMEELRSSQLSLSNERKVAELREHFIAILGHDLRNPLSAVSNCAQLLLRMPLDEDSKELVGVIKNSSRRMSSLIENTLDFAQGRLGAGITVERTPVDSLATLFYQLIAEQQVQAPGRNIVTEFDIAEQVTCDSTRIGQLFSNLLANALKYGNPETPVRIRAKSGEGLFVLSVANCCKPISPVILDRIFQPFSRGDIRPGQQGLGLGLYIAAEIARAHRGQMEVSSTEEETRFTFRMPAN
jgi:signal transduction histidine kinase